MYQFDYDPLLYHDPWDIPFYKRRRDLLRGSRRAAYFYAVPDNSTFRYRALNMVECILQTSDEFSASWFGMEDLDRLQEILDEVEVLIINRLLYSAEATHLLHEARKRKIRVIYDIDDMVFHTQHVHLVMETLDQELTDAGWHFWFGRLGMYAEVMRQCDGVITTNSYLAKMIREWGGMPVAIVPNFLNRLQQHVSDELWNAKCREGFRRDDRFHIGYFSGTPTHNRDFAIVSDTLQSLMNENPTVHLRVVGFLDMGNGWSDLEDRVEVLPLQNFLTLQRMIAETEINIVPLQQNVFTQCKSELKYFEAAVVGAWTVCSPVFTFQSAIREGENGHICQNTDWLHRLRILVEEGPPSQDVLSNVRQEALNRYGWKGYRKRILSTVFQDPDCWPTEKKNGCNIF